MASLPKTIIRKREVCGFGSGNPCPFITGVECARETAQEKKIKQQMRRWERVDGRPMHFREPPQICPN